MRYGMGLGYPNKHITYIYISHSLLVISESGLKYLIFAIVENFETNLFLLRINLSIENIAID